MGERLRFILAPDDLKRIHIKDESHVEVDVHRLNKREAARLLKNVIVLNGNDFSLIVIHGYNNGHAIKSMLAKKQIHPRVTHVIPAKNNPGVTTLDVTHAN